LLRNSAVEAVPRSERGALFEEYVVAFRAAVANSHWAHARALAERSTALFPELRRPWLHLATVRAEERRFGAAIEAARRAETARDDDWAPRPLAEETAAAAGYFEGLALYRTQRVSEALPRLRAARKLAPSWAEAARLLGEAEFVAGHMPAAAAAYGAAFDLEPGLGTAQDLAYWAEAQAAGGDVSAAIASIQEALRRSPYAAGLHARLGDLLRRDGQLAEAYYELVLEGLLHGAEGPFTMPAVNMATEIVRQARADTLAPGRHELLVVAAGLASLDAGDAHKATHQLLHALRITRSASAVPRLVLADALLRSGDAAQAQDELQRLLASLPDFVPALVALADTLTKLGRTGEAERALERARALFPDYWKLRGKTPQG
jgi:tetratricopeptide (TPR) repeat protein